MKSLIFWSAAALLVFGEWMILRAWWSGKTPPAGGRRSRVREFVWIALPVALLSITLIATWRAQRRVPNQTLDAHAGHAS